MSNAGLDFTECDKLHAVSEKSQAIGEFLEWLLSGEADDSKFKRPVFLATYEIRAEEQDLNGKYIQLEEDEWEMGEGTVRFIRPIEELLAKFFKIDLNKVEQERRALLEQLRNVKDK